MRLGFVGTGTIAAAMIEGLATGPGCEPILISPRNAKIAADLAGRFANVTVAENNQAVLDGSDMIVLAVRPQIAAEVLSKLRFRADHHVVSLVAAVTLDFLHKLVAPAATVTRAIPLPPVARRQGPTTLYPPDAVAKALFDRLGVAIALEDERSFDAFSSATAVMAAYFAFAHTVTGWMERHGVRAEQAHTFVRQMLEGLASAPADQGFAELAREHQTKGGLNEQVFDAITRDGILPDLDGALDGILARLRAAPR